ncbi:MAG: tetratricopeptide repeat protein [Acidobacteriota bacterium]
MIRFATLVFGLSFCANLCPVSAQVEHLRAQSERAGEALAAGNYATAISIYLELTRELPDLPGLKMNLGMAYSMAGQNRQAIDVLSAAVSQDPGLLPAWFYLGASHLQAGHPEQAARALRKYVAAKPEDGQGRQMLGDALLAIESFVAAAQQFEVLLKLDKENPRVWYGLGRSYEGLAVKAFDELERMAPESAYWLALVADSRTVEQQYKSAFYFYRKALGKKPNLRGIHVALSQIYRKTGHPEWAETEERKELALGLPDCDSERLVCDFLEGRFRKVAHSTVGKNRPEAYYWQSRAYNQLASAAFSSLGQLRPSFALHELIAEIHRSHGRYLESANEWRKALQLSPQDPVAKKELAVSLFLSRDFEGAQLLVDQLLGQQPGSPELNFLAGDILLNQQQARKAVVFLKKALDSDPDLLSAHASLGRAYLNLGEAARAIPHLKKALATDRDGSTYYQLARAYRGSGEQELASQALQKYQQIQKSIQAEKGGAGEELKITPP